MGDRSPKDRDKKKKQEQEKHQKEQAQKVIQMNEARARHNGAKENNTDKQKEFKKAG
jgi:hypothetical protein